MSNRIISLITRPWRATHNAKAITEINDARLEWAARRAASMAAHPAGKGLTRQH